MPFCIGTPDYGAQATDYIDALQKLIAFINEDNNYVATMAVNAGGSGWSVGDYFDVSGGTAEEGLVAVGRVTTEAAGVVTGVEIASMGAYSVDPAATGAATSAVTPATGTGLTVDLTFDTLGWVIDLDQLDGAGPERETFFHGIGLDDAQAIYGGIRTHRNVQDDLHNWEVVGATGYNSALDWDNQPGQDVDNQNGAFPSADVPLIDTTLPYWFYVNKQRIAFVLRPSTVYVHGYLGFGLPFGPLSLYPYPLVWAGSARGLSRGGSQFRYSENSDALNNILDPANGSAYIRWVDGVNHAVAHYNSTGSTTLNNTGPESFPFRNRWDRLGATDHALTQTIWTPSSDVEWLDIMRDNGGEYPAYPVTIWNQEQFESYVCELDRVRWVPGFSVTSEDELTLDGVKHRVFQNCFRTDRRQWLAYEEQ